MFEKNSPRSLKIKIMQNFGGFKSMTIAWINKYSESNGEIAEVNYQGFLWCHSHTRQLSYTTWLILPTHSGCLYTDIFLCLMFKCLAYYFDTHIYMEQMKYMHQFQNNEICCLSNLLALFNYIVMFWLRYCIDL